MKPEVWKIATVASVATLSIFIAFSYWERKSREEKLQKKKERKESRVDIGGIFGMDAGGTLTKIVYFEADTDKGSIGDVGGTRGGLRTAGSDPYNAANNAGSKATAPAIPSMKRESSENALTQLNDPDHKAALAKLYTHLNANYGAEGKRDVRRDDTLSCHSPFLNGKIHFLHFETKNMIASIQYLSSTALVDHIKSIGCTGGGAHKYASDFEDQLSITVNKFDELGCLVRGMHFALLNFKDECYTYRPSEEDTVSSTSSPTTFPDGNVPIASPAPRAGAGEEKNLSKKKSSETQQSPPSKRAGNVKEYMNRVVLPISPSRNNEFPYLVVNIGSGVSIVKVSAAGRFERVSGTSLGGGTYWGLCRLLTDCESFEELLEIAEQGNPEVVDMLVKDIYGSDYAGMLSGNTVASSFGKLVGKTNPREGVKQEDLAIALLMMLTNNIGQVAHLNAQLHGCSKIYFLGNFLRQNVISCRRLAFAIDFWSKGEKEAIFLVHEGYFGALGTFLMSAFGSEVDIILAGSANDAGTKEKGLGRRKSLSGLFAEMDSSSNSNNNDNNSNSNSRGKFGRHRSSSLDGTRSMKNSRRSDRLYDGDNKFGKFISKGIQSLRNMSVGGTYSDRNSIRNPLSPRARSNTISSDAESLHSEQSGAAVTSIPSIGMTNASAAVVQQQTQKTQPTFAIKEGEDIIFNDTICSVSSPSRGRTVSDDYVVRSSSSFLRSKNSRDMQQAPNFAEAEDEDDSGDGEESDFFLGDTADRTPRY